MLKAAKQSSPSELPVGSVRLPNRVVLAPMSGVTDAPFRRMAARLGAGLVVSEMTASQDLVEGCPRTRLRAEGAGIGIHVVQLAGCEARWMAQGARLAQAAGADIIDINMGCPARHVTGGQAGSALMRDLDHAATLIEATVAAVSIPVTLKMRLGWDHRSINAAELARRAENAGVQLLTVHGRTRCQFYKGQADWRAIRAIVDSVAIPVVVNGDIDSFDAVDAALSASGAQAVMLGRAAEGRPWLPGQVARYLSGGHRESPPPLATQFEIIRELYEAMLAHHGTPIGRRHARKHLGWALDAAADTAGIPVEAVKAQRQRVLTEDDPRAVHRHLAEVFDAIGSSRRAAA